MATQSGIKAGKAFVIVEALDKTGAVLKRVAGRVKDLGASIAGVGAKLLGLGGSAMAPMLAAVANFAKVGDNLDKMSIRTGASVEELSTLGYTAEQSGSSLDALGGALFRMRRRIANAATGGGPAVRALNDLGLAAEDLTKLTADQQLRQIADALSGVEDESLAAQYAFEILGDGAKGLLPMLKLGSAGILDLQEKAKRMGLQISTRDAKNAAAFSDAWATVTAILKSAAFRIGASLGPMLTSLLDKVAPFTTALAEWIDRNRELVAVSFKVAAAVMAAGIALIGIGGAIGLAGVAISGLATIVTTLSAGIAMLVSTKGLVVAALAAIGAGAVLLSGDLRDTLGGAIEHIKQVFGKMLDAAQTAWGGIVAAIKAGDLGMAMDVAWQGVRVIWLEATQDLMNNWTSFVSRFMSSVEAMRTKLAKSMTDMWADVQTIWQGGLVIIDEIMGRDPDEIAADRGAKVGQIERDRVGANAILDEMGAKARSDWDKSAADAIAARQAYIQEQRDGLKEIAQAAKWAADLAIPTTQAQVIAESLEDVDARSAAGAFGGPSKAIDSLQKGSAEAVRQFNENKGNGASNDPTEIAKDQLATLQNIYDALSVGLSGNAEMA